MNYFLFSELDFTVNKVCGVFSRLPLNVETPTETLIIIDDEDFVLMAQNMLDIEKVMKKMIWLFMIIFI